MRAIYYAATSFSWPLFGAEYVELRHMMSSTFSLSKSSKIDQAPSKDMEDLMFPESFISRFVPATLIILSRSRGKTP